MKYIAAAYDKNENEYIAEVRVRSNAKKMTVLRKCAEAVADKLFEAGAIKGEVRLSIESGNVWTNGGFGSAWITADGWTYEIGIEREGVAYC